MRILITASRDWSDVQFIRDMIDYVREGCNTIVIVHGDCPTGGDRIADTIAIQNGWTVERHPAKWSKYGKKAGFIRNSDMVKLGVDVCLAFIKDNSKGASMCAKLAEDAGIPTFRIRPFKIPRRRLVYV